jgi:DNA-binding GntR family transcriptional regulator
MNTISEGVVLKRTCMRDRIREVLVARILDGTYAAGTQLKELSLAREFNVSQTPIREALRELEGSGLVMNESYELRRMLEVRSVRLAAPYSKELLAHFEDYLAEMESAVKEDDSERYIDAALRFHRRLVEGSGNRTFLSVWDSLLWDIRGRIALRRLTDQGHSLRSLANAHGELMNCFRVQDTEGAAERVGAILERVASAFTP